MRPGLEVGKNVDAISVRAGLKMAETLGYGDWQGQMVAEASLVRWGRGEEASGEKLWLSEYPRDLTTWKAILAAAMAEGRALFEKRRGMTRPDADWTSTEKVQWEKRLKHGVIVEMARGGDIRLKGVIIRREEVHSGRRLRRGEPVLVLKSEDELPRFIPHEFGIDSSTVKPRGAWRYRILGELEEEPKTLQVEQSGTGLLRDPAGLGGHENEFLTHEADMDWNG